MEKLTFNTSENEKFTTIGNAKLSPELIQELTDLQAGNNAGIKEDIHRIDKAIDYLTNIHSYGEQVITPKRTLDHIATLRWIIERYKIFKAPKIKA